MIYLLNRGLHIGASGAQGIVIYHSDYCGVTGDIVIPTDFAITLFPDRVEVLWGVAWCQGGAGNTEILEADY